MKRHHLAAAALAATVIAGNTALAEPLKVCFLTDDGKHYLDRGTSGGYLRALATRCKGDAVFWVHAAKDRGRTPRFGEPVTLFAEKTERYVWMNRKKSAAFASKKKLAKRDKRFFFQINPASGRGGGGASITVGDRVSIKSYVQGDEAYVPNGGGESLAFGDTPDEKPRWGTFQMIAAYQR